MKDNREEINKILENGRILSEEELQSLSGGQGGNGGSWPIIYEGEGEFKCYYCFRKSVFHYILENRLGVYMANITGTCPKCGAENNYWQRQYFDE